MILSLAGYNYSEHKLSNIIVKRNGKYGLIDVKGEVVLPIEFDYIETTKAIGLRGTIGEFGIIWKNGKCTLINLTNGEILNKIQFNKIEINNYPLDELYTFEANLLVQKERKFGYFTLSMSETVPIIYDKIEAKHEILADGCQETLILYIGNKVGIHVYMHYIFPGTRKSYDLFADITPEYDECVFIKNGHSVKDYKELIFFAIRKNDKWGILDVHPIFVMYGYDPFVDYKLNYENLKFKYDSLSSLMKETDKEFKKRYAKYYKLRDNNSW